MTRPRFISQGSTWLVTRRCANRHHLLRPSPFVNSLLEYLLAEAAQAFSIEVHAYQFLSNHYHLVVSDPDAKLPDFIHRLNTLIAHKLNEHYDRTENLWSSDRASLVRLLDTESILDKLAYVLTNAVTAGLVATHTDWPGVTSTVDAMGAPATTLQRPADAYGERSTMAEEVELRVTVPTSVALDSPDECREQLRDIVHAREDECRAKREHDGRDVAGREKIVGVAVDSSPSTPSRRSFSPEIACKNLDLRIAAIALLRQFRKAYAVARAAFAKGARDVVFPFGTWWMRVAYDVACSPSPT